MKSSTYHEMHLLTEVSRSPEASQRELSRRIGVALGLTNLMLRRLVKKGHIKISGTKRSRIRYLLTPQGILEKSRLTYQFIEYSLQLYSRVRVSLRKQLAAVAQDGHRRMLLCGSGELAEIAFLTIQEMGLELVGVVDEPVTVPQFLGWPVRPLTTVAAAQYDRIIEASRPWGDVTGVQRLVALGVPAANIISLSPSPVMNQPHAVPVEVA